MPLIVDTTFCLKHSRAANALCKDQQIKVYIFGLMKESAGMTTEVFLSGIYLQVIKARVDRVVIADF